MTLFQLIHTDHEMGSRHLFTRDGASHGLWNIACRESFRRAAEKWLEPEMSNLTMDWSVLTGLAAVELVALGWTRVEPVEFTSWGYGIHGPDDNGVHESSDKPGILPIELLERVCRRNREIEDKELDP